MQEGINCPRIVQTSAESLGLHCWVVPDPDPDPGWWLVGSMVGVPLGGCNWPGLLLGSLGFLGQVTPVLMGRWMDADVVAPRHLQVKKCLD